MKLDLKTGLQVAQLQKKLSILISRRGAIVVHTETGPQVAFPEAHPYSCQRYDPETADIVHNYKRAIRFLESR